MQAVEHSAVELRLVPIERLLSRGQRFKCVPLAAVICASTCIARQAAKYRVPARRGRTPRTESAYLTCRDCADGREVIARVQSANGRS